MILALIDAQLRLLVAGKVFEDDKLLEYDAFLLDFKRLFRYT